jgi:hypothetical protein
MLVLVSYSMSPPLLLRFFLQRAMLNSFQMCHSPSLAVIGVLFCQYGLVAAAPFPTPMNPGGDGSPPFQLPKIAIKKSGIKAGKAQTSRAASYDTMHEFASRYGGHASHRDTMYPAQDLQGGDLFHQHINQGFSQDPNHPFGQSSVQGFSAEGYPFGQQISQEQPWYNPADGQHYGYDFSGNPVLPYGQGSSFGTPDIPLLDEGPSLPFQYLHPAHDYGQGQPSTQTTHSNQYDLSTQYFGQDPASFHQEPDQYLSLNQAYSGQAAQITPDAGASGSLQPTRKKASSIGRSGNQNDRENEQDTVKQHDDLPLFPLARVPGIVYPILTEMCSPQEMDAWNRDFKDPSFNRLADFPEVPLRTAITFLAQRKQVSYATIYEKASEVMTWRMLRQVLSGNEGYIQEALACLYGVPSREWMYDLQPTDRKIVAHKVAAAKGLNKPIFGYGYLENRLVSSSDGAKILHAPLEVIRDMAQSWPMNPIMQRQKRDRKRVNREKKRSDI